jgi:hypothetical protein
MIESMFDTRFRRADDAAVVAAIAEFAAAEAMAAAQRLAAVAELAGRRCGGDEHAYWSCDGWDAAAAEVSAAMGISHGRASGEMDLGISLRTRLPKVAALFMAGALSLRVVSAIGWRTALVQDDDAMALIDAAVAEHAGNWGGLSKYKLEQAIDVWIDRHDPGALRRTQAGARNREVVIGSQDQATGTSSLWGRLYASDATVLERRLTAMAHAVCADDPRTLSQRRADALGALAAGGQHLSCQCGSPHCPAAEPDGRGAGVVIHVLTDADALASPADPAMSGDPSAPVESARTPQPTGTASILGGGVLPTSLLAELIRGGAKVRHLRRSFESAESQYRPSTALDEFIRMRDMTCRFPHCDKPAEYCDIDHAIPWPFGVTHPSGLRCLCRKHHLLKTFWGGEGGWRDEQSPDGTIVWTSPTGQTYTTRPGSRLLFPKWNTATAPMPVTEPPPHGLRRGLMMPTRRRTRDADRRARVTRERSLNDAYIAERNIPPPY